MSAIPADLQDLYDKREELRGLTEDNEDRIDKMWHELSHDDEEKEVDDRERAADLNSTGGAW